MDQAQLENKLRARLLADRRHPSRLRDGGDGITIVTPSGTSLGLVIAIAAITGEDDEAIMDRVMAGTPEPRSREQETETNRRRTMTTEAELTGRARAAITEMQAADDNEGTTLMQALDAGQECADVLARLLIAAGHPEPGAVPRKLATEERIEARHWLQQLAEQARTVRGAMDPQHGMPVITDEAWAAQWAALRRELDAFTGRVLRGEAAVTASPGAFQDRNG